MTKKCSIEESSISERHIFLVLCNYLGRGMYTHLSISMVFRKILHSRFKYRDRASIIGDILNSVNSDPRGKTKTSIMRGANLNFEQTNKYIDFLTVCDAIKAVDPLKSQEAARYKLTQKGFRFAREFETWRYAFEIFYRKPI